jgi:hypothetical protein
MVQTYRTLRVTKSDEGVLSWAVVATCDKAAGADVVRSMARPAGADIVEVEGSHVIMISQPKAVTDHILTAARAVGKGSQASTRIGPSRAVSGTTCRKRLRRPSPKPSSTSTATDR